MTLVNTLSPPLQDMMSNLAYLPCFYLSQLKETSACICSTWQAPTWTVKTSLHSPTFIPMPQPGSRLSRLLYVQVLHHAPSQRFGHARPLSSLLVTPGSSPTFWSRQAPSHAAFPERKLVLPFRPTSRSLQHCIFKVFSYLWWFIYNLCTQKVTKLTSF